MKYLPRPHQKEITNAILKNNCLIISKMGSGKTAAALDAINQFKHLTIVISPKLVTENTWPSEIEKWDNFKNIPYVLCDGNPKKRLEILKNNNFKILLINPYLLVWINNILNFKKMKFNIIIDESSLYKNPKTLRFKISKSICNYAQRVVLLTGTPIDKSIMDLWGQIALLDNGTRLGKSFYQFRNKYFYTEPYKPYTFILKNNAKKDIVFKIKDLMPQINVEINMPSKEIIVHKLTMDKTTKEYYDDLIKNKTLEFGEENISIHQIASLIIKLTQITSGFIYNDEKDAIPLNYIKLNFLKHLIKKYCNENIIIVYKYKYEKNMLQKEFPNSTILVKERPDIIENWNDKKIPILLVNAKSSSYGLNLQKGGRRIIWFCPIWSYVETKQMEARIYRNGQLEKVFIHYLLMVNTVDFIIYDAISKKREMSKQIIEYLKKNKKETRKKRKI